jgi:glutaredoxin 3
VKVFKIFSRRSCPYCSAAVQLCEENGLKYKKISLDGNPQLLTEVVETYKWYTFPVILEVVGDTEKFIGGYTDLVEYLGTGKTLLKG